MHRVTNTGRTTSSTATRGRLFGLSHRRRPAPPAFVGMARGMFSPSLRQGARPGSRILTHMAPLPTSWREARVRRPLSGSMRCTATWSDCCPVAMSQWPPWSMAKPRGQAPGPGSGQGESGRPSFSSSPEQGVGAGCWPARWCEKTPVRGQVQICPSAPLIAFPGSMSRRSCSPMRPSASPVVAVEGAVQLAQAVEVAVVRVQRQMAGPAPLGGMQIPRGGGEPVILPPG